MHANLIPFFQFFDPEQSPAVSIIETGASYRARTRTGQHFSRREGEIRRGCRWGLFDMRRVSSLQL